MPPANGGASRPKSRLSHPSCCPAFWLSGVLTEGLILLVSTAQGTIGVQPAALMGGTMVSLVEAAMREQEKIDPSLRSKCMLVCDEFRTVTGANWEGMLAEIRKYGGALVLATQSLTRLDTPERKLKAGILGNIGVILAYQMSAEDAHIVAPEMDSERVQDRFLVNANPHNCYARITSDTKVYPAFSMHTLPPPDVTRGSTRAVDVVLEDSKACTVDWQSARIRLNDEVDRQLSVANKVEGLVVIPVVGAVGAAETDAAATTVVVVGLDQGLGRAVARLGPLKITGPRRRPRWTGLRSCWRTGVISVNEGPVVPLKRQRPGARRPSRVRALRWGRATRWWWRT